MLHQLSKYDSKWRQMAKNILRLCNYNDLNLADDLVNDMYLKVYESEKTIEQINDNYIFTIIKNLFLHYLRKLKKEQRLFTYEIEDTIEESNEVLNKRLMINNALNELDYWDREILLHTSERSLRANERLFKTQEGYKTITVDVLHYSRKNALKKLKETETVKKHNKSA